MTDEIMTAEMLLRDVFTCCISADERRTNHVPPWHEMGRISRTPGFQR
jgi:hypothetical protein